MTIRTMAERRARLLLVLGILLSPAALADEAPSEELLEFLATWQREDDAWQDPMQMQEIMSDELAENTTQGQAHE